MSEDNSGKNKRNKKQEDYKQSKKTNKEFQVYFEPKTNEKASRDNTNSNKPSNPKSQNEPHESRDSRYDQSDRNKSGKTFKSNQRRSGDSGWKRKHIKHSKGAILEVAERVPKRKDAAELAASYNEVFTEAKLPPVNDNLVQLDPNDALVTKMSYGATTVTKESTTETAPAKLELFDLGKERFDPIQAMKNKQKKETEQADKGKTNDELLEGADNGEELGGKETDLEAELGADRKRDEEGFDDDEEKFSDIDAMFERKLKSNQYKEEQDVFDELFAGQARKEEIAELEDDERPVWEDIDTKEVIKEIQQKDVLSGLPQDKKLIFGDKYTGSQSQSDTRSTDSKSDKTLSQGVDFSRLSLESETPEGYHPSLEQYYATVNLFNQQKFENPNVNPNLNPNFQNYLTSQQLNTMKTQNLSPQQQQAFYAQMMKAYQQQQQGLQGNFMSYQLPQFKREAPKQQPRINPTLPSFLFRYFCQDYDEKIWYYIDLQQKIQGPFSGKMMDEWYQNGHLPLDLNVTMGKNNGFRTLKELAEIVINGVLSGPTQESPKVSNPQLQAQMAMQQQMQMNEIMKQKLLAEQQNLAKKSSISDLDNPNYSPYSNQGYNKYPQGYGNINQPDYANMQGYYGKVNPNLIQQQQKQQIPTNYLQQKTPIQQPYPYQQGHLQNMQSMQQQKNPGGYPSMQQQNPNINYGMSQQQKVQQFGGMNIPLTGNPNDISLQLKGMLGLLGNTNNQSQNVSGGNIPSSSSKSNQQGNTQIPPRIDTSDFPTLGEASK